MSNQPEISNRAAQATLSIRMRASVEELPKLLGETYGAIIQYLGELGEDPAGEPFAAYYNMDMQDLDVEAGFPVSHKLPDKGAIKANEIPRGKYASLLYTGPYADCGAAYEELAVFVKAKGFEPSGVAYEYYLNNPAESPGEEPKTLIVIPVN